MNVFEQLSNDSRTISSALSKTLAQSILNGQTHVLLECIDLVSYEATDPTQKHIRSGASKVVEIVALNRPDLVAPYLRKLLPALALKESQTRRMIIRTMGFCAHLNRTTAQEGIAYAEQYIGRKEGLSLASAADLFLGDFGALSREEARAAFPLLERSMQNLITHEQDSLLEALFRIFPNLDATERDRCFEFAERWQDTLRKSTRRRVKRILRLKG